MVTSSFGELMLCLLGVFDQCGGMKNKPELELALKALSESFDRLVRAMAEDLETRMRAIEERVGGGVEPFVTKEQVARHLDVTTRTIENWARAGKIPLVKIGGVARFRLGEVDRYVRHRWEIHGKRCPGV